MNDSAIETVVGHAWEAGVVIAVAWALLAWSGRRVSARFRAAVWSVVMLRLVVAPLVPVWGGSPLAAIALSPASSVDSWSLTLVWLAGVAGVVALSVGRHAEARSIRPLGVDRRADAIAARLAAKLHARRADVLSTERLGPAVVGVVRPWIALPRHVARRLDDTRLGYVLAHELAHVRRWDLLVRAVSLVAVTIYWFHPLVWIAAARLRQEQELACDELVVAGLTPRQRREYGHTLLCVHQRVEASSPAAAFGDATGLRRRVQALASPGSAPSLVVAIGVGLALLPVLPGASRDLPSATTRSVAVRDAGFEAGALAASPLLGWYADDARVGRLRARPADGVRGRALCIEVVDPRPVGGGLSGVSQVITIADDSAREHDLSLSLMGEGDDVATVEICVWDEQHRARVIGRREVPLGESWRRATIPFVVPGGHCRVGLFVYLPSRPGRVWLDDASLLRRV